MKLQSRSPRVAFLVDIQGGECFWCHREIECRIVAHSNVIDGDWWIARKGGRLKATLDHLIPVSRGGADDIGNTVAACWRCNADRGDSMPPRSAMVPRALSGRDAQRRTSASARFDRLGSYRAKPPEPLRYSLADEAARALGLVALPAGPPYGDAR